MNSNYPYRAKPMKAMSPTGVGHSAEFSKDSLQLSTKPMHKPSKSSVSGALVDGPYGGKKPQS